MPWNRYARRERPDYSHLDGKTDTTAFAEAYQTRAFGRDSARYPARVNEELIRLFEGRERLTLAEAVPAFLVMLGAEKARNYSPAFAGSRAGNLLAWGVHLRLLTQEEERGAYVWTMPDREPWYVLDDRFRLRQVGGLTDGQAAEAARKDATLAKLRGTLRAKAAVVEGPRIEANLMALLRYEPDHVIRPMLLVCQYPQDEFATYLTGLDLPVALVEVLPIVREAHLDMQPKRQKAWRQAIGQQVLRAKRRAAGCARELAEAATDAAALEDLG